MGNMFSKKKVAPPAQAESPKEEQKEGGSVPESQEAQPVTAPPEAQLPPTTEPTPPESDGEPAPAAEVQPAPEPAPAAPEPAPVSEPEPAPVVVPEPELTEPETEQIPIAEPILCKLPMVEPVMCPEPEVLPVPVSAPEEVLEPEPVPCETPEPIPEPEELPEPVPDPMEIPEPAACFKSVTEMYEPEMELELVPNTDLLSSDAAPEPSPLLDLCAPDSEPILCQVTSETVVVNDANEEDVSSLLKQLELKENGLVSDLIMNDVKIPEPLLDINASSDLLM